MLPSTNSSQFFSPDQRPSFTVEYWDTPFTPEVPSNGLPFDLVNPKADGTFGLLNYVKTAASNTDIFPGFMDPAIGSVAVNNGRTDNVVGYWAAGAPGQHGASTNGQVAYHFAGKLRSTDARGWFSTSTTPTWHLAVAGQGYVRIDITHASTVTTIFNEAISEASYLLQGFAFSDTISTLVAGDQVDIYYVQDVSDPWGGFTMKAVLAESPKTDSTLALIQTIGGDTQVAAIYDTGFGVNVTGGYVNSWDDYRGTDYAPSLVGSGTARPSWNAAAKTITFDGVDDLLLTPVSTVFDLTRAASLVLVGSLVGTDPTHYEACYIADPAFTGFIGFDTNNFSTGHTGGICVEPGTVGITDSGVPASSTMRVLFASQSPAPEIKIEIPNHAAVTDAYNNLSAALPANFLAVGGANDGVIPPTDMTVHAVIVLNHAYTNADRDAIKAWAVARHGAVLA